MLSLFRHQLYETQFPLTYIKLPRLSRTVERGFPTSSSSCLYLPNLLLFEAKLLTSSNLRIILQATTNIPVSFSSSLLHKNLQLIVSAIPARAGLTAAHVATHTGERQDALITHGASLDLDRGCIRVSTAPTRRPPLAAPIT